MRTTLVCVSTGNRKTMGRLVDGENSRKYHYPPPGKTYTWGPRDCEPVVTDNGQPFGLAILHDFIAQIDDVLQKQFTLRDEVRDGLQKARDLESSWRGYGALMIQGDLPTDEELALAMENRRSHATEFVERSNYNYTAGQAGKPGFHANYEPNAKEWAKEFDLFTKDEDVNLIRNMRERELRGNAAPPAAPSNEDTPCVYCYQNIASKAKLCRHCHTSFPEGKTASEMIAAEEQNIIEQAAPAEPVHHSKSGFTKK